MKITYKNQKPDQVNFKNIMEGQTFFAGDDGELCMKINSCVNTWNVVSLSENTLYDFTPHMQVTPVNVELIVHAEER